MLVWSDDHQTVKPPSMLMLAPVMYPDSGPARKLTKAATRVNRRSIYAEFESKENLFERATRRYLAGPGSYMDDALTRSTAREVAKAAMHGAADTVSGDIHGCLTVGDGPGLPALRDTVVHRLAERFTTAVDDGELTDVDPTLLARWVAAVCQGIAVQARSGASRADLHAVADMAMTGWPEAQGS